MFKSFSDSIRSLWQSNTTETDQPYGEKRKRPPDDVDLDDSDVEIVSVKKPRQGNTNSTSGSSPKKNPTGQGSWRGAGAAENQRQSSPLSLKWAPHPHTGLNGDVDMVAVHPGPCVRSPSSRHSSGSSVRQGRGRRTSVQQCFQLKEKEVYRKLLQQYTSIALGCDGDRQQTGAVQTTSSHNGHTHR
ncbi:hypothetical protein ACOMHN_007073 [Nucella lapillus]